MQEKISLTKESLPYVKELIQNAEKYNVQVQKINNATIIDCGINVPGSLEAGLLYTKICLGGLAEVNLYYLPNQLNYPLLTMNVQTSHPVLATIGCQAANWNINKSDFFGMACGPGRALAQKPSKSFQLLNYQDKSDIGILCIESDRMPNKEVVDYLAEKCSVNKNNLTILMIKTNCLIEYMQMAARAVELGMFKLIEQLSYDYNQILYAIGTGVIPPLIVDKNCSNDRVNNALIYGTSLYIILKSKTDDRLDELLPKLPSSFSHSYGQSFLELFTKAGNDFSKFDLSLLAPSEVIINDITTGKLYHAGKMNLEFLLGKIVKERK